MNSKRREAAFLVRMWSADDGADGSAWRGSVQEIASGKRLFITGTRDIADFIQTFLVERHAESRK